MIEIPTSDKRWKEEDQSTGTPGDLLRASWLNAIDGEFRSLLADAGIEMGADEDQMLKAVKVIGGRLVDKLSAQLGGNDLFAPSATNGQLAGDTAYSADLNSFTTPGVYGVWNSRTTLNQIKGFWKVEVAQIGEEILQLCTSHWGELRQYIRRRVGGEWSEEQIITASALESALVTLMASSAFEARVKSLIAASNGVQVGEIRVFASETDAEVLRTVDGKLLWLRCDGRTFSATDYPELATLYPSLRTPTGLDEDEFEGSSEGSSGGWTTTGWAFVRALDVA